jgi:hypothetical protein
MIADVEEMKCTIGSKEQARPIEPGSEFLRPETIGPAGEGRVELFRLAFEPGRAEINPDQIGKGEHGARVVLDTDHVQNGRVAWSQ